MRRLASQGLRRRSPPGVALLLLALLAGPAETQQTTGLDTYVGTPDPAYSYEVQNSYPGFGYATWVLNMTSQRWRSLAEVDREFWGHWLSVIIPAKVTSTTALLIINGGDNSDPAPGPADPDLGLLAAATGAVVAELRMVPNQPLSFTDESHARSEDAIIAYTWDKFLRGGDETWPAQLPMTKSAVRAMDTVTDFCFRPEAGNYTVNQFIVTGGSKRGWTAWLAAATDPRVVAVIPAVIDLLNLQPSFWHHFQAYGHWSEAVRDYEDIGIMAWIGSERFGQLMRMVDPYEYRERLTMPKFLVNAAGDEFFLPDSSQFYFDDLPGEKYLRYVPNTGHSLEGTDAIESVMAFAASIITGTPRPGFSYEFPAPNRIVVRTTDPPTGVRLWQATNPTARDFRVETIGQAWTSTPVADSGNGVYEVTVPAPAAGWTAFFVELTYPSPLLFPFKFTTPVRVVPQAMPYPPPIATVLSASGGPMVAPGAIASGYGSQLAPTIEQAADLPLPTELAGTSVRVTDVNSVPRLAPLFFVSPGQINYLMPEGMATGLAKVEVFRGANTEPVTYGYALVDELTPGIFSANADGKGVAAALSVRVKPDLTQIIEPIFDPSEPLGSRTGIPLDLYQPPGDVYLSLYCTGMGPGTGPATATVGGVPVDAQGPVPSPEFVGVQQINLGPLPQSLARAGEVDIVVTVDGKTANVVTVVIK